MYDPTKHELDDGRIVRSKRKTDAANTYQALVTYRCREARPSGFHPTGQVIVTYELHLGRDLDADNVMKAINDALAVALGVNDKQFLPVTVSKEAGCQDPFVRIGIFDAGYHKVTITP